jgi:hypothetical protein
MPTSAERPDHCEFVFRGATASESVLLGRLDQIQEPMSASELSARAPSSFSCSHCSTTLVTSSSTMAYAAMPSEYWAELVESWICHSDQELNANILAHKDGALPRADQVLVATAYLLVPARHVVGCRSTQSNVSGSVASVPSDRKETRRAKSIATRLIARRVIHRSHNEPFQALQLIFATRNPRCRDYMIGHTPYPSCILHGC